MKKVLILTVLMFALTLVPTVSALLPTAWAEVTLSDYRALTMLRDIRYEWEYLDRLYELRFKQYGQPITSSDVLNPDTIEKGRTLNVPGAGDVLVVNIVNNSYVTSDTGVGYFNYQAEHSNGTVSMNKVAAALSAFPGKVVVIINSKIQGGTKEAALTQASTAFSGPKFTLLAFFQDADVVSSLASIYQGLGYKTDNNFTPLARAYADADSDGIVTASELCAYVHAAMDGRGVSLLRGEDLPVFFSTNRQMLELKETSRTLEGRESFKVGLSIAPAGATGFMEWSSGNKKVATVDQNGVVTGVAPGKTDIILKADGKVLKLAVTVRSLAATSASIAPPEADVYVYDFVKLSVKTEPVNATEQVISWSSSNKKVATVDKNGLVHALRDGQTVITAKTKKFPKVRYTLTVKKVPVTKVGVVDDDDEPFLSIRGGVGASRSFEAYALPRDASFRDIKWVSDRPKVAKVTASGTIRFMKPGSATIRAVAVDDPSIYYEIKVTVLENQRTWNPPNPADYALQEAKLYVLPKRLYYVGSKLMGEVYVFNHTASSVKSINSFRACLINTYYYDTYESELQCILASKNVKKYTFNAPIPPEGTGVYRFPIAYRKKIDIPHISNRAPMLFRRFPNF